jgi:hypothetical protein
MGCAGNSDVLDYLVRCHASIAMVIMSFEMLVSGKASVVSNW